MWNCFYDNVRHTIPFLQKWSWIVVSFTGKMKGNWIKMNMQWHLKTKQIYQKVSCVNSPADCLSCLFGRRQEWTKINSSATEPSQQSGYKPPTMQSACHLTNLTFTFKQDTWISHTIICLRHAQLSNIALECTENIK